MSLKDVIIKLITPFDYNGVIYWCKPVSKIIYKKRESQRPQITSSLFSHFASMSLIHS